MKAQRFTLENTPIRGELVRLDEGLSERLSGNNNALGYSPAVQRLLSQFFAASALLASTLKFEGSLSLQARSSGSVSLIMAECSHDGNIRGLAKANPEYAINASELSSDSEIDLSTMLKDGTLAITITPTKGERYQGIVPLNGDSLAQCLEHYFEQSEQLKTRLWFAANGNSVSALLLQALPSETLTDEDWSTAIQLAETISDNELLQLNFDTVLYRLFHSIGVRTFDQRSLVFQCSCGPQRGLSAIRALGAEEVNDILKEQQRIQIDCEFCGAQYVFEQSDILPLFGNDGAPSIH